MIVFRSLLLFFVVQATLFASNPDDDRELLRFGRILGASDTLQEMGDQKTLVTACYGCGKQGTMALKACYMRCGKKKPFCGNCLEDYLLQSKMAGLDQEAIDTLSCADCQKNNPILPEKQ